MRVAVFFYICHFNLWPNLSVYLRKLRAFCGFLKKFLKFHIMVETKGFEPSTSECEPSALPLMLRPHSQQLLFTQLFMFDMPGTKPLFLRQQIDKQITISGQTGFRHIFELRNRLFLCLARAYGLCWSTVIGVEYGKNRHARSGFPSFSP